MVKKIPDFKTVKEERAFWDSHSSADYWDDTKECTDSFKRSNLKSISLKLDPGLLEKIKIIARKRGLSYNAMMRYILSKGIEKEIREG